MLYSDTGQLLHVQALLVLVMCVVKRCERASCIRTLNARPRVRVNVSIRSLGSAVTIMRVDAACVCVQVRYQTSGLSQMVNPVSITLDKAIYMYDKTSSDRSMTGSQSGTRHIELQCSCMLFAVCSDSKRLVCSCV